MAPGYERHLAKEQLLQLRKALYNKGGFLLAGDLLAGGGGGIQSGAELEQVAEIRQGLFTPQIAVCTQPETAHWKVSEVLRLV